MSKGDKKSKLSKYMESLEDEDDIELDDDLFLDEDVDLDSFKHKKKSRLSKYMESMEDDEDVTDEDTSKVEETESISEKPEFDWGGVDIGGLEEEIPVSKPKKTSSTTLDKYFEKESKKSTKIKSKSNKSDEIVIENNDRKCIICGKPLPKNNISDKCDDCLTKFSLVDDLNEILVYISPGESFTDNDLIKHGFNTLKLHILLNKLMDEKLIGLDLKGNFSLANTKRLNEFFSLYGDEEDLLDEDVDEIVSLSDDFVDIADYSDYVKIHFDEGRQRWVVRFFYNNKYTSQRKFRSPDEANREALTYLRQLGEITHHKEETHQEPKSTRSKYKGVYYSPKRNKWGASVKGYRGKKFIGHFDTEEEAYLARKKYLDQKEKTKQELIAQRRGIKAVKTGNSSGEGIYFSKQSGKWIVRLKNDEGKYVNVGRFDTEEEAIRAKDDYLLNF